MKLAVILLAVFIASSSAKDLFEMQLDELLSEDSSFSCEGKVNGNYADPQDCSHFFTCSNGHKTTQNCPAGLAFNAKINQCDYPQNVDGCGSSGPAFCHGKSNGDYADPANCHGFITCSNGIAYHTTCPASLVFDKSTKRCENIACSVRDEGYFTDDDDHDFCSGKKDGNYVDPDNCEGFISCSNGITHKMDCPAHLRYNAKTDKCDYPKNVKCGPTQPPTTPAPTTNAPTTPSASPFCKGKKDGNYVDPDNCEGFISCSNGITHKMDCPAGLRYNVKTDQCDWPKNVICGSTKPPSTPAPPTNPTTTPSEGSFCKGKKDGNYVDPDNCEGFISCSNGITHKMDCPAGLRYNAKKDQCDWPKNVVCGPTTKPPTPSPTTSPHGNSKFCRVNGRGIYRDPHNCLGYIVCYRGNIYFRNCRRGLRFNSFTKRCDLPRHVKCAGAGGGTFCVGKRDGDYVDVVNCNGFIKCSNGYTYYFDCPSNLMFNLAKDWCDWPRNVHCPYKP